MIAGGGSWRAEVCVNQRVLGRTITPVLDAYGLLFSKNGVVLGWWCGRLEVAELKWYVLGIGVGFS